MAFFPVRCFTCGKPIKWECYENLRREGQSSDDALDTIKMTRMCCRRMFLGHVPELEEAMMLYPTTKDNFDHDSIGKQEME